MNALLLRADSTDQGTFGTLSAGEFTCFTGELPWRENQSSVSCIPEGTYQVVWAMSPRFRRFTYRLLEVPYRAGILKHSANLMGDATLGFRAQLNGCIALGEKLGWIDGQKALLVSAPAMRRFESFMNQQPFTLEIRHV
jgi:hypothetical protein